MHRLHWSYVAVLSYTNVSDFLFVELISSYRLPLLVIDIGNWKTLELLTVIISERIQIKYHIPIDKNGYVYYSKNKYLYMTSK